jgi:methyl-accepting chemotaxis protein
MAKSKYFIGLYIALLTILAALAASFSWRFIQEQSFLNRDIAFFILLATLAEGYNFVVTRDYMVSAHPVIHIAIIFLLPPPAVALVVAVSIVIEQIVNKVTWYKLLFNTAHHVIITTIPAILLALSGQWGDIRQLQQHQEILLFVPLIIVLYYLLDISLVNLVIALDTGENFFKLWVEINRNTLLFDLTLPAIGLILAVLWLQSPLLCLLLPLPIMVNHFALKILKELEVEAQQTQEALKQLETKLALEEQTARQILLLANQLYEVSLGQTSGSQRQAAAVVRAVTALTELSQTAAKLAKNAETSAQLTSEISANTSKARNNVDNAIQTISGIGNKIGNIASSVGNLNEQINRVRDVAVIMRELAEEVKLLALNATIEAAGAGAFGRRFSIVAQEVRELAEESQFSARQVSGLITQVQSSSQEAMLTSEVGVKEAESTVHEAQEAVLYNLQILSQVEQIATLTKQTSLTTSQQQTSTQQVLELMKEIEGVTQQSAGSARQIEQIVAELKEAAGALNQVLS